LFLDGELNGARSPSTENIDDIPIRTANFADMPPGA
jgi:hypothetical protein